MRFYKCDICGKIVAMVKSTDVDTVCCGQPMRELVPGTTDGAKEKHVPVYTVCGSTVTVAASYDGGPWETVAELAAQDVRRRYGMPFVPRRHGTLRLRLKGRGQITLRSIAKTMAAAKGGIAGGEV